MRIVSLLPAATDWLVAFGAVDRVVGRSHACDAPEVRHLPVLTRPTVDPRAESSAIDRAVRDQLARGLSLFDVDLDALRTLRPDLVVTQAQCEVCAVPLATLEVMLADTLRSTPALLSLKPSTFKEALDAGLRLGRAAGCLPAAMRVIADGEARLRRLHARLGRRRDGALADRAVPTAVCIEWLDPLMTAGHWVPDLISLAGCRAVCANPGAHSAYVDWKAIQAADPDAIAVAACGFTLDATRRDLCTLTEQPGWAELRAVQTGRVYLFDGNAYFNRPGPSLYRAVELLSAALHGDPVAPPEPWEMQSFDALYA